METFSQLVYRTPNEQVINPSYHVPTRGRGKLTSLFRGLSEKKLWANTPFPSPPCSASFGILHPH